MLDFKEIKDINSGEEWIETSLIGKLLLNSPYLNKGTAFTFAERREFQLLGKLPDKEESLSQQLGRCYLQFLNHSTRLRKVIFLESLFNTNQVLFYKLVSEHLLEMLPLIYTPTISTAVKTFNQKFRNPRGLFISYNQQDYMEEILDSRSLADIEIIAITDGERVLGIGDQGIGGIEITIAKLKLYTLFGGLNPNRLLPIVLDVGTNNPLLLNDPMYLGCRHKRITGKEYDAFINKFVTLVQRKFPHIFLHWEDFGRENARRNLEMYRNQMCTFNDDMQGTGVVTLAALLAAVKIQKSKLSEQRIVIFGAGTAGTGIADQICAAMQQEGLSAEEARQRFWLIDRQGLLTTAVTDVTEAQVVYQREISETIKWQVENNEFIKLAEVVNNVHPTVLIGSSAMGGVFTQAIVQKMAKYTERPIIFPLSNPTANCEALPEDLIKWTEGKVLVATGSPFDDVEYEGRKFNIAQCNNALVFPGIGLGIIAVKAKRLTDNMLWAACVALADYAVNGNNLLPSLSEARKVAHTIAVAVAKQAVKEGLADNFNDEEIMKKINETVWVPKYLPYKRNMLSTTLLL